MATRPQVKRIASPPPADTVIENTPNAPETMESDLQSMMAELAGSSSSSVTVYRSNKGQQLAYVFKCTPDAFSLDTLRDKYNGGEFRLFITKEGQLWKNKTVYVEPKQASAGEAPPTQAAELAAAMREGFAKQAELMANVLRTIATPAPSPVSLLSGIDIPAAITAISALLSTLRPPPPQPVPQGVNPDRAIDMLMKGFELARELKGNEGGAEPTLMGLMSDLLKSPMVGQMVAAAQAQPQAQQRIAPPRPPQQPPKPPAQPLAPPLNTPPVQVPAQSFASETQPEPVNPMLTQYLALLCAKAADGADPALYADLVLDNLDPDLLDTLLARLPTPVDGLIADHAAVAEHREWFEQLVAIIKGALAPEAPPVAQSGINEGPPDHASGNTTSAVPGGTPAG